VAARATAAKTVEPGEAAPVSSSRSSRKGKGYHPIVVESSPPAIP